MPDVLAIEIEKPEVRMRYDRLASVVTGNDWDMYYSGTAAMLDNVTNTGMLLPRAFHSDWYTSATSPYDRLGTADYSLTTPASWVEASVKFNGDKYLHSRSVNEKVYTGASWPINQGFFVSFVAYNSGDDVFKALECGWAENATDGDVRCRFYSDGSGEVYRNGTLVTSQASIVHKSNYPQLYGPQGQASGAGMQQMARRTVDLMLLPCRKNELLVTSPTEGGGFNVQFPEIDTSGSAPVITGAGKFWWYCPTGQATVQCVPLRCGTASYLVGPESKFRYPPQTGWQGSVSVYYDTPGYGSVSVSGTIMKADLSGTFLPDGTADTYRVKVAFTGDGTASPFIYGARAYFAGSAENTGGTALDISSYSAGVPPPSLYVGERAGDTRFNWEIFSPDELSDTYPSAAFIGLVANRPMRAMIGTVPFLTGRTEMPDWEYASAMAGDRGQRIKMEARDYWKVFENYRIVDTEPLDGMNLGSAVSYLVGLCGFGTAQMEIETSDVTLGTVSGASKGEFVLYPDATESVADWLKRLHDDYATNWYMGWTPKATGPVFRFVGTATLGTVPSGTLWSGASGTADHLLWYRSFNEEGFEPEANEIRVFGRDPRTLQPIVSVYVNADSVDPTTAPNARDEGWLGERRRYGLVDPAITSQELANQVAGILRDRLTTIQRVAEWSSTFLLKPDGSPIWVGDVVKLTDLGSYRVKSLSCDFPAEGTLIFREARYIGEYIGA